MLYERVFLREHIVTRHNSAAERINAERRLSDEKHRENKKRNKKESVIFNEKRKYFIFKNVFFIHRHFPYCRQKLFIITRFYCNTNEKKIQSFWDIAFALPKTRNFWDFVRHRYDFSNRFREKFSTS